MIKLKNILIPFILTLSPLSLNAETTTQNNILLAKNGIQVTDQDLLLFLAQGGDKNKQIVNLKSTDKLKKIINYLYLLQLLANQAIELKLDQEETIAYQLKQARLNILKGARLQDFKPKKMPDFTDTAKLDYLAYPEKYQQADKVQVAHVMVNLVKRTDEEALARIKAVQSKIQLGQDIGTLAKDYSDDYSSNDKGGILDPYAEKALLTPFAKAAFALNKTGDISAIVKTVRGYHIIQLIKKIPAHLTPFDEVKAKLIQQLEAKYTSAQRKEFLLAEKAKIEAYSINDKNLAAFTKKRLKFLNTAKE